MLTQLVIWLNAVANAVAQIILAPAAVVPGWVSATAIGIATGVLMLVAFKYTSNQGAIKQTRNGIKANLLALSLFKDSIAVGLRSQGRILVGAARLLMLSLVPMAVMLVPTCLLLSQLALWYQARPLRVGEQAVVTLQLASGSGQSLPEVQLQESSAATTTIGPVRVPSKDMICWNIEPRQPGYHRLTFHIEGSEYEKQLAVGDAFMRTSIARPNRHWSAVLLNPGEVPFAVDSPVQSIEIDYPERSGWITGSNSWLIYWFAVSMVAAFAVRPLLKVNI